MTDKIDPEFPVAAMAHTQLLIMNERLSIQEMRESIALPYQLCSRIEYSYPKDGMHPEVKVYRSYCLLYAEDTIFYLFDMVTRTVKDISKNGVAQYGTLYEPYTLDELLTSEAYFLRSLALRIKRD